MLFLYLHPFSYLLSYLHSCLLSCLCMSLNRYPHPEKQRMSQNKETQKIDAQLQQQLTYLNLPFLQTNYEDFAAQAAAAQWTHVDYLSRLIAGEAAARQDGTPASRAADSAQTRSRSGWRAEPSDSQGVEGGLTGEISAGPASEGGPGSRVSMIVPHFRGRNRLTLDRS